MNRKTTTAVIVALAVVLAGALTWGIVENVRQRSYRLRLQAMYERSFFELVGGMDDLEVKLGKLMVSDGAKQDVVLLSEVYRQADGAGRELSALPGAHESMEEVMAFVNRLSEFSGALTQKVARGESISRQDEQQLETLLERCKALNYTVQHLRAEDVTNVSLQAPLARPEEGEDPYAAFANPSTPVPSLIYDGAFSQAARTAPKALGTESVDEDAAREIARSFVGAERVKSVTAEQGVDGEIPCWGVVVDTIDAGVLHVQISKTGGHVLMMMPEYSPGETNHPIEICRQNALDFLKTREYGEMEAAYYQTNFGMITFNFVPVADGVRLYPDLVKVQVSMETGLVIGLEANNYLRNHVARDLPDDLKTEEEIRSLAVSLKVESVRLALIPKNGQEILCYELRGTSEEEDYLVYLNAQTAQAEDILKVVAQDEGEEVV